MNFLTAMVILAVLVVTIGGAGIVFLLVVKFGKGDPIEDDDTHTI